LSYQDRSFINRVAEYLFGESKDSKYLDLRTRVKGEGIYKAILYYRFFEEKYNCKTAGIIADIMERLAISIDGKGREEAVQAIQKTILPKTQPVYIGSEEIARTEVGE
jgi:hypothetical protein